MGNDELFITTADSLGGSVAQADWLGPKVISWPMLLYIYQVIQENLHCQCHGDSTINVVMAITILLLVQYSSLCSNTTNTTAHSMKI